MDHDRLFKQLLRTFFLEFIELLLPQVAGYIDPGSVEFLDKEIFTDLSGGDRHEVDLLVKCRVREETVCFLVHIEIQSSVQRHFDRRFFVYFARLSEQFALPVYPIVLFTHDEPKRAEGDTYQIRFPDLEVLTFRYRTIQLNQLDWRQFVRRPNPVAAALIAKMRIPEQDRPRVKLECLRLLATLKLDKAKQALIWDFMDSYLRLSPAELEVYDSQLGMIEPANRETVMAIVNEFEARGEARGEVSGMARVILTLTTRRFGAVEADLAARIRKLPADKLEALAGELIDLESMADIRAWVAAND